MVETLTDNASQGQIWTGAIANEALLHIDREYLIHGLDSNRYYQSGSDMNR